MMDATNKSVNKTNTQKTLKTSNNTHNGAIYSDNGRSVSTPKQYGSFESKKSSSTTPDDVKKARKNDRKSRKIAKMKKSIHKFGKNVKETFKYTGGSNGKYCSTKSENGTFYNDVKWFWDIRKWIPILLVVFIFSIKIVNTKDDISTFDDATNPEVIAAVEEIPTEPATEETTEPTLPIEEQEVIALARLADTCARRYGDDVKRIVMWVAINRSEDRANGYGGSLLEEINRPKQWQEYNPDGAYTASTLEIARDVYDTWKSNGPRPMYNDMIFFAFNADGTITVRNKFKTDKRTNTMIFGY